ncbi:bifunctional protein-serine/threonine kinase/phosphatase [Catenovulum sp. 2E275]|uniref:bifunctional protein-serine/threonine kinase/phosphatase n=1 Tax=Catenovulum sp. 2E275 TaxID=2980497 RepID=UPI0021CF2810|nr:bifunctional protein-serine/threonine kinase/phosphatase [Catenovulum sp. 2E275]MCU4676520.1 bifunctional protein-serine/threonine kinase/phosphatase [Catenovulum sp. 2E275]
MQQTLILSTASATSKGVKAINQDYLGQHIPKEPVVAIKGASFIMADGISSSSVSQLASQAAVQAFLEDYYCTPDLWSVESSVFKVLKSINTWVYAQTQNSPYKYNKDKGYVCTVSVLVITPECAHVFNAGDTRIYQLRQGELTQLSIDHRKYVSSEQSYLSRGLGINQLVEIDYQRIDLAQGDIFMLATDGIYEFLTPDEISHHLKQSTRLQTSADELMAKALKNSSNDNLSIQLVKVEQLNANQIGFKPLDISQLNMPPQLNPRMKFEGYQIIRQLYISSRSHVYLAQDLENNQQVALKIPSTEQANDSLYLERFMLEDWIAKRVNHANVVSGIVSQRQKKYAYLVTEYIEGQNLDQWMRDNPKPSLNQVRHIVSQIADGLQAFHRQEMVHQDLRPQNIMIDNHNTVKIIDFGSTYIAGVTEVNSEEITRGTLRYSAPEYFLGQAGTQRSDIFALAVITYQMLTGAFPYSNQISQAKSRSAQNKFSYKSLISDESECPAWVDDALKKALQIDPWKRYSELSEFVFDLHHPNKHFLARSKPPLIERDPVMFWQSISVILTVVLIAQFYWG